MSFGWSDITDVIGNVAPLLGGVLAGPAGAAAGRLVASVLGVESTPDAVSQALKSNPKALIQLKKLEQEHARELRRMTLEAETSRMAEETQRILAVNETMQAEGKAEHWPQWLWRPFNGFTFGVTLFCNYAVPALVNSLVLPWLANPPPPVVPGSIPEWVFVAWGSILGVTSWHRGAEKRAKVGDPGLLGKLVDRIK